MTTRDIWIVLTPKQKLDKLKEALEQLNEIDKPDSRLKHKLDQGRLANVKKSLEQFVIDAVAWESDRMLHLHGR